MRDWEHARMVAPCGCGTLLPLSAAESPCPQALRKARAHNGCGVNPSGSGGISAAFGWQMNPHHFAGYRLWFSWIRSMPAWESNCCQMAMASSGAPEATSGKSHVLTAWGLLTSAMGSH